MKIYSHHLVRNEERWLWYSVTSVINYVDKILLWDMESDDNTPKIIAEIRKQYPEKVSSTTVKKVDPQGFAKVRQQMLDETDSDWFIVVDGDEIWWDESIRKVTESIRSTRSIKSTAGTKGRNSMQIESIVVPMYNVVGDIFHYQEEKAGMYTLTGKKGHYALRAIKRNIPGLSSDKPHGTWGWTDKEGKMIQDRDPQKIKFIDAPYIHTTYLQRGGSKESDRRVIKRPGKFKYEIGIPFPKDFYYPEAFFKDRPQIVPSPWTVMSEEFKRRAIMETPLRKIKRRVLKGRVGY